MKFIGYERKKGNAGIRNKVLILPTVSCARETARIISENVSDTAYIANPYGCAQIGKDAEITKRTLKGLALNPNVYGVLVIGLGCESIEPAKITKEIGREGEKQVKCIIIQNEGGTSKAIAKGIKIASHLSQEASSQKRIECELSNLVVGLKCGSSDATSGISANPALGYAIDLLIENEGNAILSETTELIGAEHILAKRAKNEEIKRRIYEIVEKVEKRVEAFGGNLRGSNPSPGNIKGDLTTIEEKSLGCIQKSGSFPIREVLDYAQSPKKRGLVIMETPGYGVESVTGMVAGGANIIAFTTGRGTPIGNPIAPVLKITGNPLTYKRMKENIDISAGEILKGKKSIEAIGKKIFEEIIRVANGKVTKAESFGFSEIGIFKVAPSV